MSDGSASCSDRSMPSSVKTLLSFAEFLSERSSGRQRESDRLPNSYPGAVDAPEVVSPA